jgi:hypothetical protein
MDHQVDTAPQSGGGDIEKSVAVADDYNDEKPTYNDGAQEVLALNELDPAMDRKIHLVNNVRMQHSTLSHIDGTEQSL